MKKPVVQDESPRSATFDALPLPLIVAVTGHRDLVPEEVEGIRGRVRRLLSSLQDQYPNRRLRVMSSLAEGADRLVAHVALAMDVDLIVPLPMPRDMYVDDFESQESRDEFDALCDQATEVFELPFARGCSEGQVSVPGSHRNRQYAQLGIFLCAHCHILLALWDGKTGVELGGTGQVVKFHHDTIMPGYSDVGVATRQALIDDESDLVYHIVCSRDRENGAPADEFDPLECSWFTTDRLEPRTRDIPEQHRLVFRRSGEFSEDAMRLADKIEAQQYPLMDEAENEFLPVGAANINGLFCIADSLAIYFQKNTLAVLRYTHVLAFLMGLMFIIYSDFQARSQYLRAFLFFFVIAAAIQFLAKRHSWHRKYLDYRALAEGLRVQFYLAAAGVRNVSNSKFLHDNFLQTQDPELGWIRNVMRVAGTRSDAAPVSGTEGVDFATREWIGDESGGQLGYYSRKAAERVAKSRITDGLGSLSLLVSVVVVVLLLVAGSRFPETISDPLVVLMGATLLLFGIRHSYAEVTAEKELIKQYEFMLRIFGNARRRMREAESTDERRQVLLGLGCSALDEHAEWILMHRDRSIDQSELWRMGS